MIIVSSHLMTAVGLHQPKMRNRSAVRQMHVGGAVANFRSSKVTLPVKVGGSHCPKANLTAKPFFRLLSLFNEHGGAI
jgi:hypothetical protein